MRRLAIGLVAGALLVGAAVALRHWRCSGGGGFAARSSVEVSGPAGPDEGPLRWIAIGGGSSPEQNQVSIEQDMGLAASVLGPGGEILFAGGPGSHGVQVLDAQPRGDPLMRKLAEIFSPRAGRDSHYRPTALRADGPATEAVVLARIREAASRPGGAALLLYLAGHGEQGQTASDNLIRFWGHWPLTARDLAEQLDEAGSGPKVRVVATSCFSGGFAELAFLAGDPARGPAQRDRCGLFSSTWDLESSGCDPDPERQSQQGYGLHFLNALRRADRDGRPLPDPWIDFDGDGRVSLLEAHARVRIASEAADVPTTTSERWLRHVALVGGPESAIRLPEEDAVVTALAGRLGLAGRLDELPTLHANAQDAIAAVEQDLEDARVREEDELYRLSGELLSRWPVIDDPWHPDFAATLASHGKEVEAYLGGSEAYAAAGRAREAVLRLEELMHGLRLRAAPVERLLRAVENRAMAARLAARGGPEWEHYERLLACERSVP